MSEQTNTMNNVEQEVVQEQHYLTKAAKSVGKSLVWGLKVGAFVGGCVLTIGGAIAIVEHMRPNS